MAKAKAKAAVSLTEKAQVRWRSKVKKTSSCWIWVGGLTDRGYGSFRVGPDYVERAHVLSYLMFKGEIAEGLLVRHICPGDVHYKHCVNPNHLVLGTDKDNGADKAKLGTFKGVLNGEKNPMVKLTDAQVLEIHKRAHNGDAPKDLSKEFNVSSQQIGLIRDGRTRKYLGLPEAPIKRRGPNKKKRVTRRGYNGVPLQDEIDRFEAKVDKGSDCWIWTGATDAVGKKTKRVYGRFWFRGDYVGAHIFSYLRTHGSVSPKLDISHKCANSLCVRPEHLWARTRKQNMANKTTRKRLSQSQMGNRNRAVLTDDQIRQIKEIYRDEPKLADQEIVERFSLPVGAPALARIRKGETGKHILVEGFVPRKKKGAAARGSRSGRSKLKTEQVYAIRRRRKQGEQAITLAAEFGMSRRSVDDIVARQTWKHLPEEDLEEAIAICRWMDDGGTCI